MTTKVQTEYVTRIFIMVLKPPRLSILMFNSTFQYSFLQSAPEKKSWFMISTA